VVVFFSLWSAIAYFNAFWAGLDVGVATAQGRTADRGVASGVIFVISAKGAGGGGALGGLNRIGQKPAEFSGQTATFAVKADGPDSVRRTQAIPKSFHSAEISIPRIYRSGHPDRAVGREGLRGHWP